MLRFDPDTGLYADPTDRLRAEVRADWQAAFARDGLPPLNVEPETPAGQLADSQTAAIADKDGQLLYLANQFNPLTAEGVWQDALGKIYFLTRKVAESSVAVCLCKGLPGTVIPAGALIRSAADGTLWRCAATTAIPTGGAAEIPFRAGDAGPLAAGAHTLTEIVTVTPGWDSVDNPAAAAPGRDAESRAEFETRRAASVAKNAHGSVAALHGAIADIPGVLDLAVLENTGDDPVARWGVTIPGHSIRISVHGGEDAAIAEAVYRKKDGGCGTAGNTEISYSDPDFGGAAYTYRIERPEPLAFGVRVALRATPDTPAGVEEAVKKAVLNNFNGLDGGLRVGMADIVYASRFYAPALAAGVRDLVGVKICAPAAGKAWADEVTVNADRVPVLSADDITVVIEDTPTQRGRRPQ